MVGLRSGASHFLIFFSTVLLIQLTVVSIATFSVAVFRDFANASMVGFAVFGYSNFGGGCFIPANKVPIYVSWVKWISYIVCFKLFLTLMTSLIILSSIRTAP
jgi:hypothetical protein